MRSPADRSATNGARGRVRVAADRLRRSLADGRIRGVAGVTVLAAGSLVIAFVQQAWVTTQLGPGVETDAYFAALGVPQLMIVLVAGPVASVLLPLLSTEQGDGRRRLFWTATQGVAMVSVGVALVLAATAGVWVPVTVPGFDGRARELAIDLARVLMLFAVISGLGSLQAAAHRADGRMVRAEIGGFVASIIGFGSLVVTLPLFGVAAAAWTLVGRAALTSLLMLPGLGRYSRPRWSDPAATSFRRRAAVLFSATTFTKSDLLLDRVLASLAPAGSLTLLNLAQTLYSSIQLVLNRAFVLPAVPRLATLAQAGSVAEFGRATRNAALLVGGLAAGGLVAVAVAGEPVLAAVFARSAFDLREVEQLWWYLLLLGGVLVTGAAGQVVAAAYYASGAIARVSRIAVTSFFVGVALKLAGFWIGSVEGLAVATSFYYAITLLSLVIGLLATSPVAAAPVRAVQVPHAN